MKTRKVWSPGGHHRFFLEDGTEVSDEAGSSYCEGPIREALANLGRTVNAHKQVEELDADGSIEAALADLKRIVNAPSTKKGTAKPILGPGWTLSPPAWATFPLSSFEADDGSVDEGAAQQWLRENEMAAWPESFMQAPCRVRMAGETEPTYTRSSGQCICDTCNREYWRHQHAEEWLDWQGYPWLRRLCDGRLVKL